MLTNCKSRRLEPMIIELLNEGLSYEEVGKEVGMHRVSIKKIAFANNINPKFHVKTKTNRVKTNRVKTNRLDGKILDLFDKDLSPREIGVHLGISTYRVNKVINS